MVEVTQADRDAAMEVDCITGERLQIVAEAFARHRLATEATKDAEIAELVALLRECSDNVTGAPEWRARIDIALAKHGGCDE